MSEQLSSDIRVYIVEDQALIRQCLRAMLDLEEDFRVVGEAEAAEEALEDLQSDDVDLVLMDIGLPGIDGIAATRALRERRPELPVVMLTSHQSEFVAQALWAGASGYILKTSTRQQLVQAIRAACNNQVQIDAAVAADLFSTAAPSPDAPKDSPLTERQVNVLKLVANGVRYRKIASKLFVSEATVNREMRNIFNRLGVNDAMHAVSEAYLKHLL